jgi:hypothetical protein
MPQSIHWQVRLLDDISPPVHCIIEPTTLAVPPTAAASAPATTPDSAGSPTALASTEEIPRVAPSPANLPPKSWS